MVSDRIKSSTDSDTYATLGKHIFKIVHSKGKPINKASRQYKQKTDTY